MQKSANATSSETDGTGAGFSKESQPVAQRKSEVSSFLEEERKAVQAQFRVRPLTVDERRAGEDLDWALHDPNVQSLYQGELVVPYERQIVAHGHNTREVLSQAARVTGRRVEDLPLVSIVNPLAEINP